MQPNSENLREGLLARLPQPERLAEYRQEVTALIEKNEKGLRRQKWYAGAIWIWVVLLGTMLLMLCWRLAEKPGNAATVAYLGTTILFFLIAGAVELLKYFISHAKVELLKETKQVQLQLLELQAMLRKPGV
jgi:hypothetical protein